MLERDYGPRIAQAAEALHATLTAEERALLRFGLLPAAKTQAAEGQLAGEVEAAEGRALTPRERCDLARLLAVAVMGAANRGPDGLVV